MEERIRNLDWDDYSLDWQVPSVWPLTFIPVEELSEPATLVPRLSLRERLSQRSEEREERKRLYLETQNLPE